MKTLKNLKSKKTLTRQDLKSLNGGKLLPPGQNDCSYEVFYCDWAHGAGSRCNQIGQCCG